MILKSSFNYDTDVLVFTHIPKCGGTSVHGMLSDLLGGLYVHFFPGSWENLKLEKYLGGGGHQKFGSNPLCRTGRNVVNVTVLRDPVSRFFSFYSHVANHPEHHLHNTVLQTDSPYEFALECYENNNFEISNIQTKMLAGRDDASWQNAAAVLETEFSVVGCVEDLESFAHEVASLLRSKFTGMKTLNKGFHKSVNDVQRNAAIDFVLKINQEDMKLYNHFFG